MERQPEDKATKVEKIPAIMFASLGLTLCSSDSCCPSSFPQQHRDGWAPRVDRHMNMPELWPGSETTGARTAGAGPNGTCCIVLGCQQEQGSSFGMHSSSGTTPPEVMLQS